MPALLLLASTGCGDSSGESTASGSTGADTGTGTSADSSTSTNPTTGSSTAPTTTGTPGTTGEPGTGSTTSDVTADCGFDDSLVFDRMGTVWQLRSEDGETCVWLERRDDSEPDTIYKAVPYTLLAFKAGHTGAVDHLTDQARMTWVSTHHNWMDVAEAWDDAVRYRLEDKYPLEPVGEDFVDQFDLSAIDEQTKAVLWGPIRLHPYKP